MLFEHGAFLNSSEMRAVYFVGIIATGRIGGAVGVEHSRRHHHSPSLVKGLTLLQLSVLLCYSAVVFFLPSQHDFCLRITAPWVFTILSPRFPVFFPVVPLFTVARAIPCEGQSFFCFGEHTLCANHRSPVLVPTIATCRLYFAVRQPLRAAVTVLVLVRAVSTH